MTFLKINALEENLRQIVFAAQQVDQPLEKTLVINSSETDLYYSGSWEGKVWRIYELFWYILGYESKKDKIRPFAQKIYDSLVHYVTDLNNHIEDYRNYFEEQAKGNTEIKSTDSKIVEARQFLNDWQGIVHFFNVLKKDEKVSNAIHSWFYLLATIEDQRKIPRDSFANLLKLEHLLNGKIPIQSLAELSCLSPGSRGNDKMELEVLEWIKEVNRLENKIKVRHFGKALAELIKAIGNKIGKKKPCFDWLVVHLASRECNVFDQIDSKHTEQYFPPKALQKEVEKGLKQLVPESVNTLTAEKVNQCWKQLFSQFRTDLHNIDSGKNLTGLNEPSNKIYQLKEKETLEEEIKEWLKQANYLTNRLLSLIFGTGLEKFVEALGDETELAMLPIKLDKEKDEETNEADFFQTITVETLAKKGLKCLISEMVNEIIKKVTTKFLDKSFEAFKKQIQEEIIGKALTEFKGSRKGRFKVYEVEGSKKFVVIVAKNRLDLIQRFSTSSWGVLPINVYVKGPKGCWVIAERVTSLKQHQITSQEYRMNKTDQPVLFQLANVINYHLDPLKSTGFSKHKIHLYPKKKITLNDKDDGTEIDGDDLLKNDLVIDLKGKLKIGKLYVKDDSMKGWNFSIFERLCLQVATGDDGVINKWVFNYLMNVSGLDEDPRAQYLREKFKNSLDSKYEVKSLPEGYSVTELDEQVKLMIEKAIGWVSECYGSLGSEDEKFKQNERQTKKEITERIVTYFNQSGAAGELFSDIPKLVIQDLLGSPAISKLSSKEINYYQGEQDNLKEKQRLAENIFSN